MRTVFTTDWHVGRDPIRPELTALCDELQAKPPDLLILGGDIGDPWLATWPEIIASGPWRRLQALVRTRQYDHLPTKWIHWNHDSNAKADYLPGSELVNSVQVGKWLFLHGWEFSPDWGWLPIGSFAFWLARTHPRLMVPIYHLLFTTPGQNKEGATTREKWNWQIETGHSRARRYAQKSGLNIAVGHFHCRTLEDEFFADAGHNVGATSWLELTDGHAELRNCF